MTFEQAFAYTDKIKGGFHVVCCEKLWEYAIECYGNMVEVGVHYGRSASLLLQAASETHASVVLVDIWPEQEDTFDTVLAMLRRDFPHVNASMFRLPSASAAEVVSEPFGLVHIDAGHYEKDPGRDCACWLPKLSSGGIACFHDYGVEYPAVTEAVDFYTNGWENLGNWATLAIRRKP